jgi:hypothetical protein
MIQPTVVSIAIAVSTVGADRQRSTVSGRRVRRRT